MKRKVNRVGTNTLTVSLPSKWAKRYGVKAGDEIDVEEEANSLKLSKQKIPSSKSIEIEIKNSEDFLKRFLIGPYTKGYNTIKVKYQDPKVHIQVQDTMSKYLLGFEIMDHGKGYCVLKNVAEGINSEFDSNQRKIFLQVKMIIHDLIDAIKNKNMPEIEQIIINDLRIDKLSHFMRRILNTKGYKDDSKSKSFYYITNLLETVSDHCRDICKEILSSKIFPSKKVLDILKMTASSMDLYYELFYKIDMKKIVDFKKMNNKIKKEIINEFNKNKYPETFYFHHLLSIAEFEHNLSEELD